MSEEQPREQEQEQEQETQEARQSTPAERAVLLHKLALGNTIDLLIHKYEREFIVKSKYKINNPDHHASNLNESDYHVAVILNELKTLKKNLHS